MKKRISFLLIIALILPFFIFEVKADDTIYEVNTAQEFETAISEIHNNSNSNFTININSDIDITEDTSIPTSGNVIDNGNNVTIKGNGHTLSLLTFSKGRLIASGGTLNLGSTDGNDVLYIKGQGEEGNTSESLVSVSDGTVNMYNGVTIYDNYGQAVTGGAVRIRTNGTFNMYGGTIRNNASLGSGYGGAIMMDYSNGTFNMYGGEIKDNYAAAWGGAICMYGESTAKVNIKGGTISGNKSTYGGAIAAIDGEVLIEDAILKDNEATGYGGVILSYYSAKVTMNRNLIKGNTAPRGGAIVNWGDTCTLSNNVIEENSGKYGGAIRNNGGTLTSENNVIRNNTAEEGGGAIYTQSTIVSSGDEITLNNAKYGAGVYIASGKANFATTKVYNNKATEGGSDYLIGEDTSEISIMNAEEMNQIANIDEEDVEISSWMADEPGNRYSLSNYTDEVSTVTAGISYCLIAAKNYYEVSFDDDGNVNNANVIRKIARGGKIKIDANGGTSSVDEIELANDIVIDNPIRENYNFDGWSVEDVEGYALALKANWVEKKSYSATFKIVNGTWSDGTSTDKTITIDENSDRKVILKYEYFPIEMIPNENCGNGSWNYDVTEDIELEENVTYIYTYTEIPDEKETYKVTFKVVNGTWQDGTSSDKTIEIEENEDGKVVLKSNDIPVGMLANENYMGGSWDYDLTSEIELTSDVTYTYSFIRENEKYTVTFKIVNGTWSNGTSTDRKVVITADDEGVAILKETDIPTGMKANYNYEGGSWDKISIGDIALTADATYTYTFDKIEQEDNNIIDIDNDPEEPDVDDKKNQDENNNEQTDDVTTKDSEKESENEPENNPEKESENEPENNPEKELENEPENNPEKESENEPENTTEKEPENESERKDEANGDDLEKEKATNGVTDKTKINPKTNDNILIYYAVLIIAFIILMGILKKDKSKPKHKAKHY